MQLKNQTPCRW